MADRELPDQLAELHAAAFGWAVHCCVGDCGLAEEALQAAYAKAVQGQVRPSGGASLKTWWFGVVRLTAREEWRRQRRWESGMLKFLGSVWPPSGEAEDARPQPGERMELDEEAARLRQLLAELPTRQSETLHLVFYQELSIAEAAAVMGVGLGSARQHYERGKRRLRELLEAEEA